MKFSHCLSVIIFILSLFSTKAAAEDYQINDGLDFEILIRKAIDSNYDFTGDCIIINRDIDVAGKRIPKFNGIMKGNNHTISMTDGLVDTIGKAGEIRDITVSASGYLRWSKYSVGAIANVCYGLISNCENTVSQNGSAADAHFSAGGICGIVEAGGQVINCTNSGSFIITDSDPGCVYFPRVGGIAGWNKGDIHGCRNTARIKGTGYHYCITGGIAGDNHGSILFCTNEGSVESELWGINSLLSTQVHQFTGGIAGKSQGEGEINCCRNSGNVANTCDYVAGIVAYIENTNVLNCLNRGSVTSTDNPFYSCASGICSYIDGREDGGSYLQNCINTASVSSSTTNGFTATAAGVCATAKNVKAANCLNFGSLNAAGTHKFKIETIGLDSGELLNKVTTVAECNAFSSENNKSFTNPFLLQLTGSDKTTDFKHDLSAGCNAAPGRITLFLSAAGSKPSAAALYDPSGSKLREINTGNSEIEINGLQPETKYFIELRQGSETARRIQTVTPGLNYSFTATQITSSSLRGYARLDVEGLENVAYTWRLGDGETGEWTILSCTDTSVEATGLKENIDYHLRLDVIWDGGSFTSPAYRFTTAEAFPDIEIENVGLDYIDVVCRNAEDMKRYGIEEWGVAIKRTGNYNPALYFVMTAGKQRINDLENNTSGIYYDLSAFTVRDGEVKEQSLPRIQLKINQVCDAPLSISRDSVMVKGAMESTVIAAQGNRFIRFDIEQLDGDFSHTFTHIQNKPIKKWTTYYAYLPHNGIGKYRYRCRYSDGSWPDVNSPWVEFEVTAADLEKERLSPWITSIYWHTVLNGYIETRCFHNSEDWTLMSLYRPLGGEWKLLAEDSSSFKPADAPDEEFEVCFVAKNARGERHYSDVFRQHNGLQMIVPVDSNFDAGIEMPEAEQPGTEIDREKDYKRITIYSIHGAKLGEYNGKSIRSVAASLEPGVYILRIEDKLTKKTEKLMIP